MAFLEMMALPVPSDHPERKASRGSKDPAVRILPNHLRIVQSGTNFPLEIINSNLTMISRDYEHA